MELKKLAWIRRAFRINQYYINQVTKRHRAGALRQVIYKSSNETSQGWSPAPSNEVYYLCYKILNLFYGNWHRNVR